MDLYKEANRCRVHVTLEVKSFNIPVSLASNGHGWLVETFCSN